VAGESHGWDYSGIHLGTEENHEKLRTTGNLVEIFSMTQIHQTAWYPGVDGKIILEWILVE
jgi:hypothetical protein